MIAITCILMLYAVIGVLSAYSCDIDLSHSVTQVEPLKGLVFFQDLAASKDTDYNGAISLEFLYCLPSDVVTGKSGETVTYDWTNFETKLDDIKSRNHQAIVRFRYEHPGQNAAIPQYIRDLAGYSPTTFTLPDETTPTEYVDWANSEIQWFSKQFLTDFATKYDSDPRIGFIQLGFGHWSEYHIYGNTNFALGVNFPTKEYQAEYFTRANTVFLKTPYSFSISVGDGSYAPGPTDATFRENTFGLFDDSFMHETHEISSNEDDGWNEKLHNAVKYLGTNEASTPLRWTKAPIGGEISYYTSTDQHNFLSPDGMYGTTWAAASAKYHITYMFANDVLDGSYGSVTSVTNAGKIVGYSLQISKYKRLGEVITVTVKNNGIAPMYHEVFVEIVQSTDSVAPTSTDARIAGRNTEITKSTTSIIHLLPGASADVTITLSQPSLPVIDVQLSSPKLYEGQYIPYYADCKVNNSASMPLASVLGLMAVVFATVLAL